MAEPDSPLSLPDGEDKEANKIGKQLRLAAEDDADGRHAPITSTRKRRISRITMSSPNLRDCSLQERESIIQQEENGESLRSLHRRRLRLLLKKLLLQRNWSEASGLLSVLLKATVKDASASRNRSKYLVRIGCFHILYDVVYIFVAYFSVFYYYFSLKSNSSYIF